MHNLNAENIIKANPIEVAIGEVWTKVGSGKKFVVDYDTLDIIKNNPSDYKLVCSKAHDDNDYSYVCPNALCNDCKMSNKMDSLKDFYLRHLVFNEAEARAFIKGFDEAIKMDLPIGFMNWTNSGECCFSLNDEDDWIHEDYPEISDHFTTEQVYNYWLCVKFAKNIL